MYWHSDGGFEVNIMLAFMANELQIMPKYLIRVVQICMETILCLFFLTHRGLRFMLMAGVL